MQNLRKKLRNKLIERAKYLAKKGYSVIPIVGDKSAAEPKKPTIKWRVYQKRIAAGAELETMFDARAGAIGVVCGQVSRLLVIDFDDHLRYQRFCRHLPQYAETYTVKTRRGYHAYFHTHMKVPSHQFDGGDIKGEKSYVVAAPSVLGEFEYRAVRRHDVFELDGAAVDVILKYFHVRSSEGVSAMGRKETPAELREDVALMYDRLRIVIGRNNALFRCASSAWRRGMSRDEIERVLLERHTVAPGEREQKFESYYDRLSEGRRTIESALMRGRTWRGDGEGIPNSVRERLLQALGSSVTARLLDIMYLAGWCADRYFCMKDALELCRIYGLNRKSVMAALTGDHCSFDGRHIVARRYVEYLDIGGLKSGKRGRPVRLMFQVPSVSRLLDVLGVSWSPSDRLSENDVGSAVAYRRALHREYVKRLSPQLPMSVMARRLGVAGRTLRRYNAELGVQVCERIGRFRLSWDRLNCLPRLERGQVKKQTPGYWLSIGQSARFPAWRHIGAELLRRGVEPIEVCMRRASDISLDKPKARPVVYESMSVESFMRLRLLRSGGADRASLLGRFRDLVKKASVGVARIRYEKLPLQYDTVAVHIAEDKIAETIRGYLYADDGAGEEVRRPARRGVAYRMLKEFGEGNVYLALRDSYGELMATMARHALRAGDRESGIGLLARSLA